LENGKVLISCFIIVVINNELETHTELLLAHIFDQSMNRSWWPLTGTY